MKKIWTSFKCGFKKLWSHMPGRVWFIVSACLLALVITVNIVATQVTLISGTLNIVFGGNRYALSGDYEKYQRFHSDYDSKSKALAAANEFNLRACEEGFVLLKNDNALPLASGAMLSVFGKNSVDLVYGGSGSGGRSAKAEKPASLYESLTDAGFKYNPALFNFYKSDASGAGRPANPKIEAGAVYGISTGETPYDKYTAEVINSYSEYNDAALVVLSRIGGEGFDLPRTMKDKKGDPLPGTRFERHEDGYVEYFANDHYLQLDRFEIELLDEVCKVFQKVILVINSAAPMELGFLDYVDIPGYNENIKGALWIGTTGGTGAMAIGPILSGAVNPSGRTVDIYPRHFKDDPTWNNFSTNFAVNGDQYYLTDQKTDAQKAAFIRYEEGIYMGYRYYETRFNTEWQKTGDIFDGERWYEDNVVFPFGFGLSYTNFDWEIESAAPAANSALNKGSTINIKVNVTNKGGYKGKDVIQLYLTAQYNKGGIEKAHKTLIAFEKTGDIPVGETRSVTLSVDAYTLASYDFDDANKNGFYGYELERGAYKLVVSRNSHDEVAAISYNVSSDILFEEDPVTGETVENRFDDVSREITEYLSRNDWVNTWPETPQKRGYGKVTEQWFKNFDNSVVNTSYDRNKPWFTSEKPAVQSRELSGQAADVKLHHLIDKSFDDPLWDKLLNQLTVKQMAALIGQGAFQSILLKNIGKPECLDYDGPSGFNLFMTSVPDINICYYASACVISATWNKEIARKMGESIGNESLWGRKESNYVRPYSGWYAPAINLHRSPFSGRNFEYYSEDPFLTGVIAGNVCSGAQSKGVYTFIKHFAVNDQETHRDFNGLATWLSEQSMRELYLKPFEIAVKTANADAEANGKQPIVSMMSSFNRIGTVWAGASYELLTEVLRGEWGFKGMVISDFNTTAVYMSPDKMIRAGGDLNLCQDIPPKTDAKSCTATHVAAMKRATHSILYTVANSNAMNGFGEGVSIVQMLPVWTVMMLIVDAVIIAAVGVWGFFVVRGALRKKNKQANI